MTIEQTIEISTDHRIFMDLPPELPIGKMKAELTLTSLDAASQKESNDKIRLTKTMKDKLLQDLTLRSLTGILNTDMTEDEIRNERLSKHL